MSSDRHLCHLCGTNYYDGEVQHGPCLSCISGPPRKYYKAKDLIKTLESYIESHIKGPDDGELYIEFIYSQTLNEETCLVPCKLEEAEHRLFEEEGGINDHTIYITIGEHK